MLVLHQFYHCFIYVLVCFYKFSGTNILTRCRSASSCFLLFLVSEILHRKYSRKRTGQEPEVLYLLWQHRELKRRRNGASGRPHHPQARPGPGTRLGQVGPPWPPPYVASPPIYSPLRENPKHPRTIPRKVLTPPPSSTLVREGSEADPGTLPEGKITLEAFFIAMMPSKVMCE